MKKEKKTTRTIPQHLKDEFPLLKLSPEGIRQFAQDIKKIAAEKRRENTGRQQNSKQKF